MQEFLAQWMPIDISTHGYEIDRLIVWVHWLMAVLFVGWSIYFVYVLVRFRAGRNPEASYEGSKSHFSSWIEAGVAIVEVVLLIGFSIPAWARWTTPPPESENPVRIRVVAQQFQWNVHYPGPDGVFGRTSADLVDDAGGNPLGLDSSDPAARDDIFSLNQLHFPVDRAIFIDLTSKDVVHSFFLPQLRVKQDAIPGMLIPVHFTATQTTPEESQFPSCAASKTCWEIACAQLCGITHYNMRGFYTVHTAEGYEQWLADQLAQRGLGPDGQPLPADEVVGGIPGQ